MCHNWDMKKASIRDLQRHTGALVQEAADGEVIVIERRGVPVAELRQVRKRTVGEAFRELERSGYFKRNWRRCRRFFGQDDIECSSTRRTVTLDPGRLEWHEYFGN